ncbi:MAG: DMT family transporter [Clostridia bacterium]|nr:DMT family transporter [Clostridia bacterium]
MNSKPKLKPFLGPAILLVGSVIWGSSFVAQSDGGVIGSFTFQGLRNTLAFLSIGVAVLVNEKLLRRKAPRPRYAGVRDYVAKNRDQLKAGLLCGIFLFIATITQQVGIDMNGTGVSVGRAGFLTALYIVLVPVFGVVIGRKVTLKAWISVAIAVGGMYLISVKPGAGGGISLADGLMIVCAAFFSMQILTVDAFSQKTDGLRLAGTEFLICAILALAGMFLFEKPDPAQINRYWPSIFYSGVMSGGFGYTLQILGQKYTKPVLASLLMSLESVFSALSDWIIRGNALSAMELAGCAVMFAAVILAQIPDIKRKTK